MALRNYSPGRMSLGPNYLTTSIFDNTLDMTYLVKPERPLLYRITRIFSCTAPVHYAKPADVAPDTLGKNWAGAP